MPDIATLGLRIDLSPTTEQAVKDLVTDQCNIVREALDDCERRGLTKDETTTEIVGRCIASLLTSLGPNG